MEKMDSTTRVQTLDETLYISYSANTHSKRYASVYSPSIYGLIIGQAGLFNLDMTTGLQVENSKFKQVKVCLRIDLVPHPPRVEGAGK